MMHDSKKGAVCSLCLAYISGECSEAEMLTFERHLPDCSDCRKEISELRKVWEVLSADMERIEPPKDLKKQVLDAAFAVDESRTESSQSKRFLFRHWQRIGASVAIIALLVTGTWWNVQIIHERTSAPLPIEEALSVSAAQIEHLIPLRSVSVGTEASYGIACIVNNGQTKQFIVYVFGVKETIGDQAYQVWLIRDNKRKSAGTFRVDEHGVGVLAMPIASNNLTFDSIGITLEPDDLGDQPRGERIFTSL